MARVLLLAPGMRAWRLGLLLTLAACGGRSGAAPVTPAYLIYVRDRQGSVVAAIDDQGQTLSTTRDDGFGLRLSATGTPVPREFLDQDRDDETGYLHFRERSYDPATAQWISPDPKLAQDPDCSDRVQGCNPYSFAGDRPTEWTDPDGREVIAYVDALGRQTVVITAGFYGRDAENAQMLFNSAMLQFAGQLHVIAFTAIYRSAAEVPSGITKFEADPGHHQENSKEPYLGSDTHLAESQTTLSWDALVPAENDRWATVIQHETLHLIGLDDSYHEDSKTGKDVTFPATQAKSPMGNFYVLPTTETTELTARDMKDIATPPFARNQGMNVSPAGFGPGTNVQEVDNDASF